MYCVTKVICENNFINVFMFTLFFYSKKKYIVYIYLIVIWGIFVILQALHNTRMINLYSRMDTRVKDLGYAIKVFAKVCSCNLIEDT